MLRYWRNCLADAKRMNFDPRKVNHILVPGQDIGSGRVNDAKVETLFKTEEKEYNENRGTLDPESDDWVFLDALPVRIAPIYLKPEIVHGEDQHTYATVYPLWIPATLHDDGGLTIGEEEMPVIPRSVLAPASMDRQLISIGTVENVDDALSGFHAHTESWPDFWNRSLELFKSVTGHLPAEFEIQGFHTIDETVICVERGARSAADAILRLYDRLLKLSTPPPLVQSLTNTTASKLRPVKKVTPFDEVSLNHSGQMHSKFALSPSQRLSLYHSFELNPGEPLAINGPPGTGKTTLIQSIIASQVVNSALKGDHPFVTVATSTNNQAVTNIIDSFGSVLEDGDRLFSRWIPDIHNFALYLPATSRKIPETIQYVKTMGIGLPDQIENRDFVSRAAGEFMDQITAWSEEDFGSIREAREFLHEQLKLTHEGVEFGAYRWDAYQEVRGLLREYAGSNRVAHWYKKGVLKLDKIVAALDTWKTAKSEILALLTQSSKKVKSALDNLPVPPPADFKPTVRHIKGYLNQQLRRLKKIKSSAEAWEQWKAEYGFTVNPPDLHAELDKTLRHDCFWLAVHYWEARWLEEMDTVLKTDQLRRRGRRAMEARWRRYAMLTPCFVSTFYTLPRFFVRSLMEEGEWVNIPLFDYIDLLLVDEAGQVSPEVGAASFSLAKKALVIGDNQQIEPIWQLYKPFDDENLTKVGLIKHPEDPARDPFHIHGFTSSRGSILRLAQFHCPFRQHKHGERGITLLEHRRCYDEIIDYCNELAYHSKLNPLRGPAPTNALFPPFVLYPVVGQSQSLSSSRRNLREAQSVLAWVQRFQEDIQHYYAIQNEGEFQPIEELIGIITPFVEQRKILRRAFKLAGYKIDQMKIGTIHALQGAEREIILFSPVYGFNDMQKGFFFDKQVNMLNVAVSRAKDTFVVIGNPEVFERDPLAPSGLLGKRILPNQ